MLPGVTAGGAEGEDHSPRHVPAPRHPWDPKPPGERREQPEGEGKRAVAPFPCPPSIPAAGHAGRMRPQLCRAPRAQLCTEQGSCGADQRPPSPSPSPPGSPQGSVARGASQKSEQMVGDSVPLPLAGRLKLETRPKSSWMGWEHPSCSELSQVGVQHPTKPHWALLRSKQQPSALLLTAALGAVVKGSI